MRFRWPRRQARTEAAVLGAMMLGDSYFTEIWHRLGGGAGIIVYTLNKLEAEGRITSGWARQPSAVEPRRRYFLKETP